MPAYFYVSAIRRRIIAIAAVSWRIIAIAAASWRIIGHAPHYWRIIRHAPRYRRIIGYASHNRRIIGYATVGSLDTPTASGELPDTMSDVEMISKAATHARLVAKSECRRTLAQSRDNRDLSPNLYHHVRSIADTFSLNLTFLCESSFILCECEPKKLA